MEKYVKPSMEIVSFEPQDVIAASGGADSCMIVFCISEAGICTTIDEID